MRKEQWMVIEFPMNDIAGHQSLCGLPQARHRCRRACSISYNGIFPWPLPNSRLAFFWDLRESSAFSQESFKTTEQDVWLHVLLSKCEILSIWQESLQNLHESLEVMCVDYLQICNFHISSSNIHISPLHECFTLSLFSVLIMIKWKKSWRSCRCQHPFLRCDLLRLQQSYIRSNGSASQFHCCTYWGRFINWILLLLFTLILGSNISEMCQICLPAAECTWWPVPVYNPKAFWLSWASWECSKPLPEERSYHPTGITHAGCAV